MKKTASWIAAMMAITVAGTVEAGKVTQAESRKVNAMDDRDLIVYEPAGEVWQTITVWTNVDCGRCRKLQGQMKTMGELGIRVRYAAYPWYGREGNVRKMQSVWCAPYRKREMEMAKEGRPVAPRQCNDTMGQQKEMAREIGITGVPAMVTESGERWVGYRSIKKWLDKAGRQKRRLDRQAERARQRAETGPRWLAGADALDGK